MRAGRCCSGSTLATPATRRSRRSPPPATSAPPSSWSGTSRSPSAPRLPSRSRTRSRSPRTVEQPAATENGHAYAAFRKPDPADEPVETGRDRSRSSRSRSSRSTRPLPRTCGSRLPPRRARPTCSTRRPPRPARTRRSRRSSARCARTGSAPTAAPPLPGPPPRWRPAGRRPTAWRRRRPCRSASPGFPCVVPAGRLVPGGVVTPAPTVPVRDPEAIRARLAAHAAGVSRGRSATTPVPADREPQEAGKA